MSKFWRSNYSVVTIVNKTIVYLNFAEMVDPKSSAHPPTHKCKYVM